MSTEYYLVKVSHGQERKLNEQFNDKIKLGKITNIVRFLCPIEEKVVTVKNKKVIRGSVIYNGYLYFQTEKKLNDDELKTISLFPNIMSLMGNKLPKLMSENDVKRILKDETLEKHLDEKSTIIKINTEVKIISGIFEGFFGTVSNFTNDGIEVLVNIFDKETKVILPKEHLTKK